MRVGVFTPLLSKLPLEAVLKKLAELNIHTVELATGNYVGDAHCKLSMLENSSALSDFKKMLSDHGFSISALSCHGNALHPDKSVGQAHRETSRKTILLAEKLGVPVMVDFSGCPGDSPNAIAPELDHLPVAAGLPQGPRLAMERSRRALLDRAREICRRSRGKDRRRDASRIRGLQSGDHAASCASIAGNNVGCNYDPSHLFWQGIDPIAAIRVLGRRHLPRPRQGHAAVPRKPGALRRARHQAVHRRARPRLDLPHLRLRTWRRVVERIHLHLAHVRLRLRPLDRARRQPALTR